MDDHTEHIPFGSVNFRGLECHAKFQATAKEDRANTCKTPLRFATDLNDRDSFEAEYKLQEKLYLTGRSPHRPLMLPPFRAMFNISLRSLTISSQHLLRLLHSEFALIQQNVETPGLNSSTRNCFSIPFSLG